ncbi:MAG TPA: thymidine kinase [Gammaproteobacteria bacterium]|nr:thymidine kinase [Gammaproteobacteria bacterium]
MAKLYFYYSAMNAGKSTVLLQSSYNYQERGMETLLFTPSIDKRFGQDMISSRIGLQSEAVSFDDQIDLFDYTKKYLINHPRLACVLLDEAQFLTKKQVMQLAEITDTLNLPVLTYGLRTDFRGEPFEGSQYLLALADNLVEIKTICHCGRKATMNARIDEHGKVIKTGEQVQIGGNEKYVSMCRKHFNSAS